jgi:hypothetical protein
MREQNHVFKMKKYRSLKIPDFFQASCQKSPIFQRFPGLKKFIIKFPTFPGFPDLAGTLIKTLEILVILEC